MKVLVRCPLLRCVAAPTITLLAFSLALVGCKSKASLSEAKELRPHVEGQELRFEVAGLDARSTPAAAGQQVVYRKGFTMQLFRDSTGALRKVLVLEEVLEDVHGVDDKPGEMKRRALFVDPGLNIFDVGELRSLNFAIETLDVKQAGGGRLEVGSKESGTRFVLAELPGTSGTYGLVDVVYPTEGGIERLGQVAESPNGARFEHAARAEGQPFKHGALELREAPKSTLVDTVGPPKETQLDAYKQRMEAVGREPIGRTVLPGGTTVSGALGSPTRVQAGEQAATLERIQNLSLEDTLTEVRNTIDPIMEARPEFLQERLTLAGINVDEVRRVVAGLDEMSKGVAAHAPGMELGRLKEAFVSSADLLRRVNGRLVSREAVRPQARIP
jgi:hypothetical protein